MTNVEMKLMAFTDLGNRLSSVIKEHMEMLEDVQRSFNQYKLLNDIRTGKIIPVVADTGRPANVTFS